MWLGHHGSLSRFDQRPDDRLCSHGLGVNPANVDINYMVILLKHSLRTCSLSFLTGQTRGPKLDTSTDDYTLTMVLPSSLVSLFRGWHSRSLSARVERVPSSVRVPRAGGRPGYPPSSYTHSGIYSFPASFSANHRYKAGKTTNVSAVEVKRPPMTTVASGRCTSAPIPCASTNGNRPSRVVIIVMTTGRSRRTQPLTIA